MMRRPANGKGSKESGNLARKPDGGVFEADSGSIFSNICTLYWGGRFAGYGNKWPSQ
jgi:hypothetical protein